MCRKDSIINGGMSLFVVQDARLFFKIEITMNGLVQNSVVEVQFEF